MTKIAVIRDICPHYHIKAFELLSGFHDVDYFFFSDDNLWYWLKEHGLNSGNFKHRYLPGFQIGRTRITPALIRELWFGNHDVLIKCINGRFALPVTYLISRLRRKPFILWTGIWMRLQTPAHRLFFPITRYIYKHADAVVVYGKHVKKYLVNEGVAPDRIFLASNAVDNDFYGRGVSEHDKCALRHQLNISPGQKVVLSLGRLVKEKGLPYLISAFSSLRSTNNILIIAGTGPDADRLKKLVKANGMEDYTRFAGYVPREQTLIYYALADVFVIPSITTSYFKEPWGLVVNEAMNQGVPVIASDAVGAAAGGLIEDGVNGFIVPERDSETLGKVIEQILTSPRLRNSMSRNAKEKITAWNQERKVRGFLHAIEYVIENK